MLTKFCGPTSSFHIFFDFFDHSKREQIISINPIFFFFFCLFVKRQGRGGWEAPSNLEVSFWINSAFLVSFVVLYLNFFILFFFPKVHLVSLLFYNVSSFEEVIQKQSLPMQMILISIGWERERERGRLKLLRIYFRHKTEIENQEEIDEM